MRLFEPLANGLVAQLNSALDYGSRGYWFESSQGHFLQSLNVLLNSSLRIFYVKLVRFLHCGLKFTLKSTFSTKINVLLEFHILHLTHLYSASLLRIQVYQLYSSVAPLCLNECNKEQFAVKKFKLKINLSY